MHAFVTHRDPVGHRDRAELEREPARGVHTVLGRLRESVQRQVARGDLVPGRRDTDLWLDPVVVAHTHRAQHAPGRRTLEPVGDVSATRLDVRLVLRSAFGHDRSLRRIISLAPACLTSMRPGFIKVCCRTGTPHDVQSTVSASSPWEARVRLLSLIHISEPTRRTPISYAVFCL